MSEKPKKKWIKVSGKKQEKPKPKSMAERAMKMYGSKKNG